MSCNPVKSPVNCGYHLPHFRDGDLNPGSSDNLPKSPQVVGSAGFDPRWYDTTAPCCGLRWRVKHPGTSLLCDCFLKNAENSSGNEICTRVKMREILKSETHFRDWFACSQIPQDSSDAIVSKAIDLWHKHCGTPVHSA